MNQLKIGFCRTMLWDRAEEYTKTFLEEAAGALAKAGAKVTDFALGTPFEQFQAMGTRIHDYEFSRGLTWEPNCITGILSASSSATTSPDGSMSPTNNTERPRRCSSSAAEISPTR